MPDSPAISVRGLSKKYRLYGSAKERLKEALHPFNKQYHREFWALRDISFDVPKGQTLGIIGRNGSGKSTLLEIICSILRPTSGTVEAEGRISALLELGAGFNPQFTGRENVIFNAELMGLSAREIRGRLPEIEAFADIGEFIDQPVKTYSSGMFVRLAFAAAINVDPDILIVDEALSVGDVKFQHRCYAKFQEFQQAGKTILFVTHNTDMVIRHCDVAVLLDGGRQEFLGKPIEAVHRYWEILEGPPRPGAAQRPKADKAGERTDTAEKAAEGPLAELLAGDKTEDRCSQRKNYNEYEYRYGNGDVRLLDFLLKTERDEEPAAVECGTWVEIYVKLYAFRRTENVFCGLRLKTHDGVDLMGLTTENYVGMRSIEAGETCVFKFALRLNVAAGDYFFNLGVSAKENGQIVHLDRRHDVVHLHVTGASHSSGLVCLDHAVEQCTGP